MNFFSKVEHLIVNRLWRQDLFINKLLRPFSWIYIIIHTIKVFLTNKQKTNVPVICIGNLTVGGSGKTPIALAIGRLLKKHKRNLAFVGHGYKANLLKHSICIAVDLKMHNVNNVGDEAILLSSFAPTYIAQKRIQGVFTAQADDFDIAVLDDGLQDNSIHKDLSIVVIDSEYILGNLLLLPAGPLRELPVFALKRADLVIVSGINEDKIEEAMNFINCRFSKKVPLLKTKTTSCLITPKDIERFKDKDFFAIIGIAHPKKFLETAKKYNIKIKESAIFSDHYMFSESELDAIYNYANVLKCSVITSSKDFVRLPKKYQNLTQVIEIEAEFPNIELIKNMLAKKFDLNFTS
ncbi:MAG: tetraacyldisaccharide 4'-kinase [Candidatus Midichloria sp.]|nr:MAG: tetraacyldisaccharide 4'-kinase [Candidatus Midichloria sp.]